MTSVTPGLSLPPSPYRSLDADKIVQSTTVLCRRIEERFPGRGLHRVCLDLLEVAQETEERARWVARPYWPIRLLNALVMAALLWLLGALFFSVHFDIRALFNLSPADFLQTMEAGINDIVLIGAALFFFGSLETRFKRTRALHALHELRSLAHVIDMHQLTKDPNRALKRGIRTPSSPREDFSLFELSRYLDYCSEMLALIGKIASLYLQEFPDPVISAAVNEIEKLTTDLSRKIWQKISILQSLEDLRQGGESREAPIGKP